MSHGSSALHAARATWVTPRSGSREHGCVGVSLTLWSEGEKCGCGPRPFASPTPHAPATPGRPAHCGAFLLAVAGALPRELLLASRSLVVVSLPTLDSCGECRSPRGTSFMSGAVALGRPELNLGGPCGHEDSPASCTSRKAEGRPPCALGTPRPEPQPICWKT